MALKKVDIPTTSLGYKLSSACYLLLADNNGLAILATADTSIGPVPTTASIFAPGCIMFKKDGTSASTNIYANSGTTASVTWTLLTIS